jgi:queuosine precursor transporter
MLPSAQGWENQDAYMSILGLTPRIAIASLIAYLAGSLSNSFVMEKMKKLTKGRWLWSRTIGSTVVGQALDTLLFVMIAFYGELPAALLVGIIISNYIFKVGIEAVMTPATYYVTGWLRKEEAS